MDVLLGSLRRPPQRSTRTLRGTIDRDIEICLPVLHDQGRQPPQVNLEMALLVDSTPWAVDVRQVHAYPLDSFLESGQGELKSMFDMLPQAVGEAEAPSSNVYFHGTGPLQRIL